MPRPGTDKVWIAGVAVATVAIALPDGGFSLGIRAGVTVALWFAVIAGLASFVFPRAHVPKDALIAGGCLAGFAILTGLSIAWASDDGRAFAEVTRPAGYLGLFTLIVCASRAGDAKPCLTGLATGIAAVGLLALGSRLVPSLPGSDADIAELIPVAAARLSYPIGYWNGLGALMGAGIVLLTWLTQAGGSRNGRALAAAAVPPLAAVIYLASSRGAAVAAAIGIAVLVAVGPKRAQLAAGVILALGASGVLVALISTRDAVVNQVHGPDLGSQQTQVVLAVLVISALLFAARYLADEGIDSIRISAGAWKAIVGIGAAVLVVVAIAANPVTRINNFKAAPDDTPTAQGSVDDHLLSSSGSGRYQFWTAATDAFQSEPLHGIGAGGYQDYWTEHASINRNIRDAHSLYLESLGELGLLGLLLILGFMFVSPLRAAARDWSAPELAPALAVLAAGAFSAAIDWTWEIPAVFAPVIVVLALITGPAIRGTRSASDSPETDAASGRNEPAALPEVRPRWRLPVLLLAAAALWVAGNSFLADSSLRASQSAVRDGDLGKAADKARNAITLQPWAAQPRLQLALVEERAGNLNGAGADIDKAIDRADHDWTLWLVKARLETLSGDIPAGRKALRRAQELNPRSPSLTAAPGA